MESLKDKTIKGTIWSGIDNVTQFGIKFVISIVLARLLSPDDYGLIGIIAIFTAICGTLIDGGFYTSLIRKKNATEEDYNTVFIINLCISVFLYAVVFVSSPFIASFFGREELTLLTRVSSLSIIIGAFSLVQKARLTKRIDFKSQTKVSFGAAVVSGVIGIGMAFLGFGVWALVIQTLVNQGLRTLLLMFYNQWMPRLKFSLTSFRELFGFGWKMLASGLIDTVWGELSQVVVGKFYSPATLGQYTRSGQFARMFSSNLTSVIQRVSFPVLSSIQEDKIRMVSAYRRIIKISMFVTAVSMFFLGAVAEPLVFCLIGSKWHEAAVYLPLICISGSTYPLHAINLNMLQVQGRSDLFLRLEIIKKTIAIIPLTIGALVGILPMLYVDILVCIVAFFLNSYYSGCLLGYSSWMQICDITPAYGLSILMAVSVYFLKFLPLSYWFVLPIQLLLGMVVFFIACGFFKMEEYTEIKGIIMSFIKKREN